jgi:hypothetical protein
MNYKKGLARIFVIGLVIAPIAGFFSASEESNKIASEGWSRISGIKKQLKEEPCATLIKNNPRDFPEAPNLKCFPTDVFWGDIREWQDRNGKSGNIIDDETITQAINDQTSSLQWNVRWLEITAYTIGYLLLWLALLMLFFMGRWIYKGFKSK